MNKPIIIKNQRFLHRASNILVYPFLFLLTMGTFFPLQAQQNDPVNQPTVIQSSGSLYESLYQLLVAELAATRGMKDLATTHYLNVASISQDPKIAEQATLLAIQFEAPKEAILSAVLWAKIDPQNLEAQLIAMTLLISQSLEEATPFLKQALEINPQDLDQHILEIQRHLSKSSALALKKAIIELAKANPANPYAAFVAAQSAAEESDVPKAKSWVNKALELMPSLTRAIELKARIIRYERESNTPAIRFLAKEVDRYPDNHELRFYYANALYDDSQVEEAKEELSRLTHDNKLGGPAILFLGEILIHEKEWQEASTTLKKGLEDPTIRSGAAYLLGEVSEHQGHSEKAIEWYSEVAPGPFHIPAVLRAITLLKKNKDYQEAIYLIHNSSPNTPEEQKYLLLSEIELLNSNRQSEDALQLANEILPVLPNDQDILYTRALTAIKLKKWEIAEQDLKKIIDENPNNASALNALGYALSFHQGRLKEALNYLQQALSISPNNPDFLDSLGWIYYRLGDLSEAIRYLQEANDLSNTSATAAHLGEVLWVTNQQEEAVNVWKNALQQDSDHEELVTTLKRLKVNLNAF